MTGKYLLTTLGCKVNQYESQAVREVLESFGLRSAGRGEPADIAVVNTCAVTANASRKNRQAIRRLARGGSTPVIVVGCGATAEADLLRELSGVSAVLGHDVDVIAELRKLLSHQLGTKANQPLSAEANTTGEKTTRPDTLGNEKAIKLTAPQPGGDAPVSRTTVHPRSIISGEFPVVKEIGALTTRIESFAGHQRAFLKVQDGCDAFCTYCIIPQLRPVPRSKPIEAAVAEARGLVEAGHREIVLTGIFLGAYGRRTAIRKRWESGRPPLAELVDALACVDGLERLRLSSLEPGDVGDPLLEVLALHDNCVPHLHLPLQSGSADVLRRMNRQYTREAFIEMVDLVRKRLDRPAISTDIIVGFPGETEDDFAASMDLARYSKVCKIHAFPYSPRDHTAAARWQRDFVPPSVVRERMGRLAELEQSLSLEFRGRFVGATERVIVEQSAHASDLGNGLHHGRADRYFPIHFESADVGPGDVVHVRIDRVTPTRTHGQLETRNSFRVS